MGREGPATSSLDHLPPVEELELEPGADVRGLVERMRNVGFNAGKLHRAAAIWLAAAKDPTVRVYFTLAGAMVPAGMR
ncbi:MAG: deoxyhypusine synthase family protein, partial [Euryarchaeota archaeon]|nr:deoxyhypusine synthase family protein [Euryarchaeota archaeon]